MEISIVIKVKEINLGRFLNTTRELIQRRYMGLSITEIQNKQ